ncbi:HAD family hydrolase [Brachybacterium sp.]|uniref:HAD family hydrolase n=1 Tax=Brachybacterium sp. TaxID=1891286 RepID=UPI002ED429FE
MSSSLQQLHDLVAHQGVRVVVTDLDGVLRVFDPSLWAELDELTGTAAGTAFGAVLQHPYLEDVTRGRGTHARWRALAAEALVDAGSTPGAAHAAIDRWAAAPAQVDHRVLAALQELREQGTPVFVLTNGTDRVPEELAELGLAPFLGDGRRFLLNTADLGAAKPDPEAYARAHSRIERELSAALRADQVAFLDDSPRHVRGAAEHGWRALHHVPLSGSV